MPALYRPFPSLSLLSEEAESGPWRSSSHIVSSVSEAGRELTPGLRRSTSRGFALPKVPLPSCLQYTKSRFKLFKDKGIHVHGEPLGVRAAITWGRNKGLGFNLRFLFLTEEAGGHAGHVAVCLSWWGTERMISTGGEPSSSSLESSSDAPNPDFLMFWERITGHGTTLEVSKKTDKQKTFLHRNFSLLLFDSPLKWSF